MNTYWRGVARSPVCVASDPGSFILSSRVFAVYYLAIDTETTGVDLRHGCRAFYVTTCDQDYLWVNFYWPVDYANGRRVTPKPRDLRKLQGMIERADYLVFQNPRFDVRALELAGIEWTQALWKKVRDTLLAGHLLASGQPHDLAYMGMQYCEVDIKPLEEALRKICNSARSLVRSHRTKVGKQLELFESPIADFLIAEKGNPDLPSLKGAEPWQWDMALPDAIARALDYEDDHPWRSALPDYSDADSATTIGVWLKQKKLLKNQGLWKIYQERLKLLPIIYRMEDQGITYHQGRLEELHSRYTRESAEGERKCLLYARDYTEEERYYNLAVNDRDIAPPEEPSKPVLQKLPKAGTSKAMRELLYDHWKLPVVKRAKTGPSTDKEVLEEWLATLNPRTKAYKFVENLRGKRKRDTAISYMDSYDRFSVDLSVGDGLWRLINPNLNPTGTGTLRFSSNNPNEQNISKQEGFNLRYIFGPAPGREWWSCDAQNIELRIPAYESEEPELIKLFERPNDPPYYGSQHLLNFSTVYPDLWGQELRKVGEEKVGPLCKKKYASTWYQWCKNGGFAVQYGAVDRTDVTGTADRAFHRPGSHSKLKSRFAMQEALNQRWIAHAEQHGYVETMPDLSIDPSRGYPLQCPRTWRGVMPTIPLNYHVQGTAMWWMCRAMIRCEEQLDRWRAEGFDGYIAIQVHDELVFDFPYRPRRGNLPKVRKLMKLMAMGGNDIGLPTPVGCEYHEHNWAEGVAV